MSSKHTVLTVSSVFPASVNDVWNKLQRFETLRYIAIPFAYFLPIDGSDKLVWHKGETFRLKLRLFGFIPLGIHQMEILRFENDSFSVYTRESNPAVPVWNHAVRLEPLPDGSTRYTDEIELFAGKRTPIVRIWANAFCRHRQKRWIKLLNAEKPL